MKQVTQGWVEGPAYDYGVEAGDGNIKSFHHEDLDVEVFVFEQHMGMAMEYEIGMVRGSTEEDGVADWDDFQRINSGFESSGQAEEALKAWMRENPLAGLDGHLICRECGQECGLRHDRGQMVRCHECGSEEWLPEGEKPEQFRAVG